MKKRASGSSASYLSTKKFHITNLGCAKNQVDAEIIIQKLEEEGWIFSPEPEDADLLIVNTCGFIETAKEQSLETAFELRSAYPRKTIVLSGCLSQRYGTELESIVPEVDGFFGNQDLSQISPFLRSLAEGGPRTRIPEKKPFFPRRERITSYPGSVYVKIAEGCNNRCSFCAIPLIRGDLTSRPVDEVVEEIGGYLRQGVFEIVLIGQDLGAYGSDLPGNRGIVGLCEEITKLPGEFWVRLLYIHPDHFPEKLLDICEKDRRILPYFDLPFQHASAPILRAMGRKGDGDSYLELIETIRRRLPYAVIRSTFMVGFPGEREEDFQELLRFQQEARLDWLGVFIYSREENTRAYDLPAARKMKKADMKRAEKRKTAIEEIQYPITQERLQRFLDTEQIILIEEKVEGEDLFIGRGFMNAPEVDGLVVVSGGNFRPGEYVRCRIEKLAGIDLEAYTRD